MSLVVRQAGSLKPDIRLAQAVSEFEATLTSEQKSSFRAARARAVSTAPTMSDVMRLTAEVDRKSMSGRCLGPRMTNALQAIQQFAALGDIIVGGGQNLIACGVWAAARLSLQIITGYFTYLESLSLLLMAIGRNAPRFQTMAALYPRSKSLQGYLCEYFIIITKICHESVTWTRKSVLSRLSATISDPQMKTFKDDLNVWSSAIKEEANVLLNQKVVEEAEQNSIFRSVATLRSDAFVYQRKVEQRNRFLDTCSQHDYCSTWKQTRKCGTTKILTCCTPYQQWRDEVDNTSILFLGKLGAGKSVLLANIVDDLNLQNRSTTLYFFARHDNDESMKARTILGSLVRQLLEHRKDDSKFSHLFPESIARLDIEDIIDLFGRAGPEDETIFIVLDGLDECEVEVQRTVLKHLSWLQTFQYKVCLSVRTSEQGPMWDTQSFQFHVSIPEDNPDIANFVESEIDIRVKDQRLITRDPNLVEEIKKKLVAGAGGMFLWTSLQIDSICAEVSDHDIREAIQDLPRDLTETFRRNLLKASSKDYKKIHIRIFKLLVSARELLTTEQLREAVSVTIGQMVWNSHQEINSIHPIIRFCGSLVMVDEEEDTVRFIHHSARSFCVDGLHQAADWGFREIEADRHMAETLVTYLSCNVFDTRVSRDVAPTIDAKEMPKRVALNVISSSFVGASIAEKVIGSTTRLKRDIGATLAKASMSRSQERNQFPLLVYAKKHWIRHTAYLEDLPSLPQWHILIDHPAFGIDPGDVSIHLAPRKKGLRMNLATGSSCMPVHKGLQPSPYMLWALSNGHIMLLNHELTKSGGAQRLKNCAKLLSLLRRIALVRPSIIRDELDYNLVRWLSRMFVTLGVDHPAKQYLLERIQTSDDCYIEVATKAAKQADFISICALARHDYAFQGNISLLRLRCPDGSIYRSVAIPRILKAALSIPHDRSAIKMIRNHNELWLFDLVGWLYLMDLTYFQWSMSHDAQLSFNRAFKALSDSGVSDDDIALLEEVLSITRARLVELRNVEYVRLASRRPPLNRRHAKVEWRPVIR